MSVASAASIDRAAALQISVSERRGRKSITRIVTLKDDSHVVAEYYFECWGVNLPQLKTWDFAVVSSLFYAMRAGKNIYVNGPVSRTLLRNLEEFQEAWALWRPIYRPITVACVTETTHIRAAPRKGVFAFSGGVDGTFAMLRNFHNQNGRRACRPIAAMFVHGFDIPLNEVGAFASAAAGAKDMLDHLGVPFVGVRTNWRDVLCRDWGSEFGAGLASCLHQFTGLANFGVLGADEDYGHLVLPWGSNPVTSHLLSGGALTIHLEGSGFTRTNRVALISQYPEIAARLRVCWEGPITGRNCGKCEKCIRTKMNFMAVGRDPLCFDKAPTTAEIIGISAPQPIQIDYLEEIRSTARARGTKDVWVLALRLVIAKNRMLVLLRTVRDKIKWRLARHFRKRSFSSSLST